MLTRVNRIHTAAAVVAGILIPLFCFSDGHALGLGLYFTAGGGPAELTEDWDVDSDWERYDTEGDKRYFGGGFVLDTAVAKNRVFNYRLNVGLEGARYEADKIINEITDDNLTDLIDDYQIDTSRLVFDNTFGFGVFRNRYVRIWLGPQLRFGYLWGDGDYKISGDTRRVDVWGGIAGIGAMGGINIHTGDAVSLGIDLGYRYSGYAGKIEKRGSGIIDSDPFFGNESVFFVNFSLLFRVNDIYEY
jgi:hypothetical protein